MKSRNWTVAFGLLLALNSGEAFAKVLKSKKAHPKAKASHAAADKGHLSTDVNFGDSVLRGQYQAPAEALARVENEKGFGDLIGVRRNFKDRLKIAADQE